jgi:hypothetical protein
MALGPNVRRRALVFVIAGVVVASGCGKEPTRPEDRSVSLAVTAVPELGDPSAPIALRIVAKNVGIVRVLHCSGCGCGNGITTTVFGPDGVEVALRDPSALGPDCPDGIVALEPRGTVEANASFTGILYRRGVRTFPTPTYPAPAGAYTVTARFWYRGGWSGAWTHVERTITFVWQ